jgi:hypothetical protein
LKAGIVKILLGCQCKSYARADYYFRDFAGGGAKIQQNSRFLSVRAQQFHGISLAM